MLRSCVLLFIPDFQPVVVVCARLIDQATTTMGRHKITGLPPNFKCRSLFGSGVVVLNPSQSNAPCATERRQLARTKRARTSSHSSTGPGSSDNDTGPAAGGSDKIPTEMTFPEDYDEDEWGSDDASDSGSDVSVDGLFVCLSHLCFAFMHCSCSVYIVVCLGKRKRSWLRGWDCNRSMSVKWLHNRKFLTFLAQDRRVACHACSQRTNSLVTLAPKLSNIKDHEISDRHVAAMESWDGQHYKDLKPTRPLQLRQPHGDVKRHKQLRTVFYVLSRERPATEYAFAAWHGI